MILEASVDRSSFLACRMNATLSVPSPWLIRWVRSMYVAAEAGLVGFPDWLSLFLAGRVLHAGAVVEPGLRQGQAKPPPAGVSTLRFSAHFPG